MQSLPSACGSFSFLPALVFCFSCQPFPLQDFLLPPGLFHKVTPRSRLVPLSPYLINCLRAARTRISRQRLLSRRVVTGSVFNKIRTFREPSKPLIPSSGVKMRRCPSGILRRDSVPLRPCRDDRTRLRLYLPARSRCRV